MLTIRLKTKNHDTEVHLSHFHMIINAKNPEIQNKEEVKGFKDKKQAVSTQPAQVDWLQQRQNKQGISKLLELLLLTPLRHYCSALASFLASFDTSFDTSVCVYMCVCLSTQRM